MNSTIMSVEASGFASASLRESTDFRSNLLTELEHDPYLVVTEIACALAQKEISQKDIGTIFHIVDVSNFIRLMDAANWILRNAKGKLSEDLCVALEGIAGRLK